MTSRPPVGIQPTQPSTDGTASSGPSDGRSSRPADAIASGGDAGDPMDLTADGEGEVREGDAGRKADVHPTGLEDSGQSELAFVRVTDDDLPSALLVQYDHEAAALRRQSQFDFDDDDDDEDESQPSRVESPTDASIGSVKPSVVPFPPRPTMYTDGRPWAKKKAVVPAHEHRKESRVDKRDSAVAGLDFKIPIEAMCLPNDRLADFTPWNGNHPEDALNEQVIKTGFYDKLVTPPQQHSNETASARGTLWPQLKSKACLQTMSSILGAAFEKRQARGRVREPSNFKPPPRVTVPDHRREAFLRELADPSLPVRRLNRGIPYGIKGKGLMEQCLSKNIPTARAVWLAKIVGANEMRAYKRKGPTGGFAIGGESKWVREWTVQVEQFVESTMDDYRNPSWKANMDYVIRLTCQLYSDHLLDEPHFLDWLVTSLASSDLDKIPFWLLLAQIFMKSITYNRRRGSRFAESLLAHLHEVTSKRRDAIYLPIIQRLEKVILEIAVSYRGCLIIPKAWDKYKHLFARDFGDKKEPSITALLDKISERNRRLAHPTEAVTQGPAASRKHLLDLLDSVKGSFNVNELSDKCLSTMSDAREATITLLRWASSTHREGRHRRYLAARLLRKWNKMGVDTDAAVLAFLSDVKPNDAIDQRAAYRIVAELVRSKHFSVGRYLQSLIATGAVSGLAKPLSTIDSCLVRLITDLPLERLPSHTINLRNTLLSTLEVDPKDERQRIEAAKKSIEDWLKEPSDSNMSTSRLCQRAFKQDSMSVMLAVSHWLRDTVILYREVINLPRKQEKKGGHVEQVRSTINLCQFYIVRTILEDVEDFSFLADVVGSVASSMDFAVLAAATDTLNYHSQTFGAIGALEPLSMRLLQQYHVLRLRRPPDRTLVGSLAELFSRVAPGARLTKQLQAEWARCEQRLAGAICSPASDTMGETQTDSEDDIDRILASGTSMDEQTLQRVFAKITSRLEDRSATEKQSLSNLGRWFTLLRSFDSAKFEQLVRKWVTMLLLQPDSDFSTRIFPTLGGTRCLTMKGLLACWESCLTVLQKQKHNISAGQVTLQVLNALLPSERLSDDTFVQDAYRFRLEQQRFCEEHPEDILQLLLRAIELGSRTEETVTKNDLHRLLASTPILAIIKKLALSGSAALSTALANETHTVAVGMKEILDRLLDPSGTLGLSNLPVEEKIKRVVELADELSLPFFKLKLLQLLSLTRVLSNDSQGFNTSVSEAFFDAVQAAIEEGRSLWSELVSVSGDDTAKKIREYAEARILSFNLDTAVSAFEKHHDTTLNGKLNETALVKYMNVVRATAWSIPASGDVQFPARLLVVLKSILEQISSVDVPSLPPAANQSGGSSVQLSVRDIAVWIHGLLHLAVVHKSSFTNGTTTLADLSTLIQHLCSLLTHPRLQLFSEAVQHLFDVALYFSDHLPEDLYTQFSKAESSLPHHDPRLRFIFGSAPSSDSSLVLVKPQPPGPIRHPWGNPPILSPTTPNPSKFLHPQQPSRSSSFTQPGPAQSRSQVAEQQQQQAPITQPEPRPVPFVPRYWELLPEPNGIDTAIDLRLFAARQIL